MEWFQRLLDLIEREFERRLRRASGLDQPNAHDHPATPAAEEEEEAEIVNIPRH
jgi:hypothetical protein